MNALSPDLLKAFQDRHDWWSIVATHAKQNHANRQTDAHKAAAQLNSEETAVTGFQRIFDRLQRDGLGGTQPDLVTLHKKQAALQATILNPLHGLNMNGAVSQRRTQFWQDYERMLAAKDFTAAERHLKSATNWWQRTKITLIGGGHFAFKEWADEITGAKKHLTRYKAASDNICRIEDSIDDTHEAMGKALYKILNDKKVQRMLALPAMEKLAQQKPEFKFLTHYARRTSVTLDEIVAHLENMRGSLRLENMMRAAGEMVQKSPPIVDHLRKESSLARAREQAAHHFMESVNATKKMELHTSFIVNRANPVLSMTRDLFNDLKNTTHLEANEIENLAEVAEAKMKRWVNQRPVEANLKLMAQPGFDPHAVKAMPWGNYVVNAGLHSMKRAVWDLPIKGLSAMAAFTSVKLKQAWDYIVSGNQAPAQTTPPSLPNAQQQKPPSFTP